MFRSFILIAVLLCGTVHADIPALHSDAGAPVQLYLDFSGSSAQNWNGRLVPALAAYPSPADIPEIWARVAEKYSPFNVDVTTEAVTPTHGKNATVIISGDGSFYAPNFGGISFVGSFANSIYSDWSYVFPDNLGDYAPYVAEAVAHEAGHEFGLNHQSVYDSSGNLTAAYNPGNALTAPIMGVSYYAQRGIWFKGTSSLGSNVIQDDLATLQSALGYRPEDHGQSLATASALHVTGGLVSDSGVIATTGDTDYFSFVGNGACSLSVNVADGGTLHASANLYDAKGNLVASAADASTLGQSIVSVLPLGTYYLEVGSFGDYGDVGQYTVSGSVPEPSLAVLAVGMLGRKRK